MAVKEMKNEYDFLIGKLEKGWKIRGFFLSDRHKELLLNTEEDLDKKIFKEKDLFDFIDEEMRNKGTGLSKLYDKIDVKKFIEENVRTLGATIDSEIYDYTSKEIKRNQEKNEIEDLYKKIYKNPEERKKYLLLRKNMDANLSVVDEWERNAESLINNYNEQTMFLYVVIFWHNNFFDMYKKKEGNNVIRNIKKVFGL